ncbi:MAG: long-chain fatty acid--CoA ligase [Desulfobacterales bacterium]|nr:long-chain fatty acid--CoA ligase [Desulfobacterales bacterium]
MTPSFTNLVEMQLHSCKQHSERRMYGTKQDDGTFTWTTYAEFGRDVSRFRAGLAHLGIGYRDKVAIISSNCVEWAVGCYAAYGLGAQYVPMYESQKREEWEYILRDSGARILLVKQPDVYARVQGLVREIPGLEHVIPLYEDRSLPYCYSRLCETGKENPVPPRIPDPEDPMGMIYTSGTTGNPKGVLLSHRSMITEIQSLMEIAKGAIPFTPEDRGLSFLPWGHLMGQLQEVHILIYNGFSSGLVRDLNEIIEDLSLIRPTKFFAVPRLYTKLHEGVMKKIEQKPPFIQTLFHRGIQISVRRNKGERVSVWDTLVAGLARRLLFAKIRELFGGELHAAFSGGAALNESVVDFLDALGIPLFEGYGQTETTMAVTMNIPGSRKTGSVGKPIPNAIVKIDTSISDTKEGEGEIVVYGPLLMLGYHNLPDETAATIDPDGGCRTGDLGRFDEEGFLHLTGRIKEIYKMENGKYVSPGPLEEELKLSPYINQAMITGENQRYNVAILTPEEEELKTWAADQGLDTGGNSWKDAPQIQNLFKDELEKYSQGFKKFERPGKFKLVWDDWSVENALLTPTLKLKRRQVARKYQPLIRELYAG